MQGRQAGKAEAIKLSHWCIISEADLWYFDRRRCMKRSLLQGESVWFFKAAIMTSVSELKSKDLLMFTLFELKRLLLLLSLLLLLRLLLLLLMLLEMFITVFMLIRIKAKNAKGEKPSGLTGGHSAFDRATRWMTSNKNWCMKKCTLLDDIFWNIGVLFAFWIFAGSADASAVEVFQKEISYKFYADNYCLIVCIFRF